MTERERKSRGEGGRCWVLEVIKEQQQLRSPTTAVARQGKQQGSRWAIAGMIFTAAATADQQRRAAREEGGGQVTSLILPQHARSGNCDTNVRLTRAKHAAVSCKMKQPRPGVQSDITGC